MRTQDANCIASRSANRPIDFVMQFTYNSCGIEPARPTSYRLEFCAYQASRSRAMRADAGENTMIDTQPEIKTAVAEPGSEQIVAPTPAAPGVRRSRVVIVGAGFGGLHAARALAGADVDVLVLDRNNYHGFWPLLYQVATAGLEAESIAYPVRAILRKHRNAAFELVEVKGADFERRQVLTDGAPIDYDYLILAAGSANNYFGNDALAERTYGLKDLDDAERLRNRVLSAFERAVRETDPQRR